MAQKNIEVHEKQPRESYNIEFDFTDDLPAGITIQDVNFLKALDTTDGKMTDVSSDVIEGLPQVQGGSKVVFKLKKDAPEKVYKIECLVNLSNGGTLEMEILVINMDR